MPDPLPSRRTGRSGKGGARGQKAALFRPRDAQGRPIRTEGFPTVNVAVSERNCEFFTRTDPICWKIGASCKNLDFYTLWCYDDTIPKTRFARERVVEDDSAVRKMSDVLTSGQSMSCMDMIPCAFIRPLYARFLSPVHLQSRGCRHRDPFLFFCRLSSHQPAGSPPAGDYSRRLAEKRRTERTAAVLCGAVTMIQ